MSCSLLFPRARSSWATPENVGVGVRDLIRYGVLVGAVCAGLIASMFLDSEAVIGSSGYLLIATTLLMVGLYSSTAGISVSELRAGVRTVVLAVTVGVFAKAAMVAAVMYLFFQEPRYAVLGLAVAQIDPLAVAAMSRGSRISPRARALLAAWASFDDPITVLLTVYATMWLLDSGPPGTGGLETSLSSGFLDFLLNLALAAVALLLWAFWRWWTKRRMARSVDRAGTRPLGGATSAVTALETAMLLAMLAVGVVYSLPLAVALLGLFFRPALGRWLTGTTTAALLAATFLLGVALATGIEPLAGLVLGGAAFAAQVVVARIIPARLSGRDRAYLAAGQQNGITAIILALLLEADFPGTVGIVAPAIAVVAVLHAVANRLLDAGYRVSLRGPLTGLVRSQTSQSAPVPVVAPEQGSVTSPEQGSVTSIGPRGQGFPE